MNNEHKEESQAKQEKEKELYKKAERLNAHATLISEDENNNVQSMPVYIQKPKKQNYKAKWIVMWQDEADGTGLSILEQAKRKDLNLTDYKVRDYIMCKAGIGNFVHINQSEAAKWLDIPRPNISKSIKKLIGLGIVLAGPSAGKFKTYQINPAFVYVGNLGDGVKKRKTAIQEQKEKILQ